MYYSSVIRTCFIFIQCTRIWRNCIYISCDSIGTIIFKVYQRVSLCYFGSDDVFFLLFLIHSNLVYTLLWKYSLNLSKRHFPHISVISEGNIARASFYRDCMHEWFVENENVFKTTVIMFFNNDHHKTLHVCAQSLFYLKLIISVKCTTCLVDQIKIGLVKCFSVSWRSSFN